MTETLFTLDHRLGLGRLRAAAWLDDQTVLVATQAALWRWEPATGTVTPFAQLGAELLTVNRAAGLTAVAVDCPKRELVVVALADGREVCRLPGHGGAIIQCLALSPDGRLLASGGSDRMLRIREIATGVEFLALEHPGGFSSMNGNPDVIAWSPDGARIATADNEQRLWLWDAATGALLFQTRLPFSAGALAFAPDGRQIAAVLKFGGGSISDKLRFLALVDAHTGDLLHQPETSGPTYYSEDMHAVAYSPDGRFCAIGSENRLPRRLENPAVQIFDTATWQPVKQLPDAPEHSTFRRYVVISGLEYTPDGARLLAASTSEVNLGAGQIEFALEVWDTRTWTLFARLADFVSQVNDLALLPGGAETTAGDLLAATDEGLRRYTTAGTYTTILPGNIYRVAAAPDGSQAVVGYHSFKGKATLLDLQTGAVSEPLPGLTQALINSVAFLSDSRRYVVCHDNYWLRQVGRKGAIKKLPPGESNQVEHLRAAVSVDGKVALVSWNGTFTVLWGNKFEHSTGWLAHPADRTRATAADFAPPEWATTPLPAADWARFSTWQTYADDCRRLNAAAFSPDGAILALVSGFHQRKTRPQDKRGRVYLYRLADHHTRELVTPTEQRWFEAITWSPDGALIATGTRNGVICLFDANRGAFLGEWPAHGAEITALSFTTEGQLISASDDGNIGIWSAAQRHRVARSRVHRRMGQCRQSAHPHPGAGLEEAPRGVRMTPEAEVTTLTTHILHWLQGHGPDYARGPYNPGATEAELAALETSLGRPCPPALAALLRVVNGDLYIGEYNLLSTELIADTWADHQRFLDDGTYARFETFDDGHDIIKVAWWHPGLIPVLEDSSGNQLCIDLNPGPNGVVGQMVWWEIHEGPIPHGADSLLTLLRAHWNHLSSGKYDTPEAWEGASCWDLTQVERT